MRITKYIILCIRDLNISIRAYPPRFFKTCYAMHSLPNKVYIAHFKDSKHNHNRSTNEIPFQNSTDLFWSHQKGSPTSPLPATCSLDDIVFKAFYEVSNAYLLLHPFHVPSSLYWSARVIQSLDSWTFTHFNHTLQFPCWPKPSDLKMPHQGFLGN